MTQLSRRSLLQAGAGAAAVMGGGSLLAGCGSSSSSSGSGSASASQVATPAYVAAKGPTPDIAGDANLPDTYFSYPANPVQSVTEKAGDGKAVNILTQTYAAVTSQPPTNTAWANLQDKIGSELKIQQISAGDYSSKFSTALAGGQLPDMFFLADVTDMPSMVKATCLDLSDHLSGDNIKKYPNLAAIPSDCWDAGRFGGRLYGLPSPRGAMQSGVWLRRDDLLDAKGIKPTWSSFQEFFDLAKEINDPKGQRWASTIVPGQYIKNMLGIPNFWHYDGTTMQSWWTSDKMPDALEAQRKWVQAGLMNPDAFSAPNSKVWFSTGKAYFNQDSIAAFPQYFNDAPAGFDIDMCQIPAFDGNGNGHLWLSWPSYGRSAINKNAGDRVDTLLKVANYFAAPFGSQEYLDVKYGKEGSDYTMKNNNPVRTTTGGANTELGVKYIADARMVNYLPGHESEARKLDASLRKLMPNAYKNDAVYLYSKEQDSNFNQASSDFGALESDIVQGRKPVSAWKTAADTWWNDHGKKMADELTAAYHAAGRG